MNMSESSKTAGKSAEVGPNRETGQTTLSAIGDVSIAASEVVGRGSAAPRKTRWLTILSFLLLTYLASSLVAIYALKSAPWVQAFVTPLLPVLLAGVAFWRRQVWKFRARGWRLKEQDARNELNSLLHETANGLNAIRANLVGLGEASSVPPAAQHLKLVEQALARMDAALGKSAEGQAGK
jgi:hypothetical protein